MQEEKFRSLFEILKFLEHEDEEHAGIEKAIVDMMDKYEGDLNEEQKSVVMKELIKFEILRQREKEHMKEKIEKEEYRLMMTNFYGEQYFSAT